MIYLILFIITFILIAFFLRKATRKLDYIGINSMVQSDAVGNLIEAENSIEQSKQLENLRKSKTYRVLEKFLLLEVAKHKEIGIDEITEFFKESKTIVRILDFDGRQLKVVYRSYLNTPKCFVVIEAYPNTLVGLFMSQHKKIRYN